MVLKMSYAWYKDGVAVGAWVGSLVSEASSLASPRIARSDAGTFVLVASNAEGKANLSLSLNVNCTRPSPPLFHQQDGVLQTRQRSSPCRRRSLWGRGRVQSCPASRPPGPSRSPSYLGQGKRYDPRDISTWAWGVGYSQEGYRIVCLIKLPKL